METNEMKPKPRRLLALEYPGIVVNDANAIRTLGGFTALSKNLNEERRVSLRFNPDQKFNKPCFGDVYSQTGILLKVRYDGERKVQSVELIGMIEGVVRFNIVDYQYLPVVVRDNKVENIYRTIIPDTLVDHEWFDDTNAEPFLVPCGFGRMEPASFYQYNFKDEHKNQDFNVTPVKTHGLKNTVLGVGYNVDEVPKKPSKRSLRTLEMRRVDKKLVDRVKKCFEERAIWSKNMLMQKTKMKPDAAKIVLPTIAYYFYNGPWRYLWVRLGYDPRKDISARVYQLFDFRLKHIHHQWSENIMASKRAKGYKNAPKKVPFKRDAQISSVPKTPVSFRFEAGNIPPYKTMLYQYCDLNVPAIKEMLDRLPDCMPDVVCQEKTGWLPSNFDERVREIMDKMISETVEFRKRQNKESDKSNQILLGNDDVLAQPGTSKMDVNVTEKNDTDNSWTDVSDSSDDDN